MSADLFAEFGNFSQGSTQKQGQKPLTASNLAGSTADPFAFPSPASSQNNQPAQQSAPFQVHPTSSFIGNAWNDSAASTSAKSSQQAAADEDDTWGDFEVAAPVEQPAPPHQAAISSSAQGPQKTRVVRASTIDLMTNNLIDIGRSSDSKLEPFQERPSWEKAAENPLPRRQKNTDPNVIFDADDFDPDEVAAEEEDDEFGDFETVTAPPKAPTVPAIDLMSSNWDTPAAAPAHITASSLASGTRKQAPSQLLSTLGLSNSTPYPQAPRSPSFQERNPFPGLALTTPKASEFPQELKAKSPSPVTAWPTVEQQSANPAQKDSFADDLGAFEDFPVGQGNKTNRKSKNAPLAWDWHAVDSAATQTATLKRLSIQNQTTKPAVTDSSWDWDSFDSTTAPVQAAQKSSIPDNTPPPTNVPPPSILLSIFPSLFDLSNTALFKPTAGQPSSVKTRILSDPKTVDFLRGYLLLATVAARVTAGRKLRWHRDKFLSQGMAISTAGGKGGMKLAGVDKTQTAREDREAADVVSVWRQHVGRLRGAVAAANSAIQDTNSQLKVPELAENMTVQTARMVPTAPRACIICGLRRDERIKGVDFMVEDSFGEFWVEHWGHRTCRNFWVEHEASLRSR